MPPASKAGPAKERDVRKFAQAYSAIQVINTQYSPMITAAPTTEQARAVQQAANRATTMAILEAGLNQSRYSEIADAVQRDASLRQAFLDEVEAQESAGDESAAEGAP
jgi:predicted ATP-binding protein involved in virulence